MSRPAPGSFAFVGAVQTDVIASGVRRHVRGKVLEHVPADPAGVTVVGIAARAMMSPAKVREHLRALVNANRVTEAGDRYHRNTEEPMPDIPEDNTPATVADRVLAGLPTDPELAMTVRDVAAGLEFTQDTVRRALIAHGRGGRVERAGTGGRWDAYRYHRTPKGPTGPEVPESGAVERALTAEVERSDPDVAAESGPIPIMGRAAAEHAADQLLARFNPINPDAGTLARAYAIVIDDVGGRATIAREDARTLDSVRIVLARIMDGEA